VFYFLVLRGTLTLLLSHFIPAVSLQGRSLVGARDQLVPRLTGYGVA